MYQVEDTIAAIATPAGVGGIGIIRLSGGKALSIAGGFLIDKKVVESKRQIFFSKFQNPQTGEFLDEGLLLVMPKPHSYTAEDVVEFHMHGSPALLEKMIEVLISQGVRV